MSSIILSDDGDFDLSFVGRTRVPAASETPCCRPCLIARARSIRARAWRVSRLNSCGSLWRAASFSASTAALRSSWGFSGSSRGLRSVIAADRVISALWVTDSGNARLDQFAVLMSDPC
jgi:hypothetical protein